MEDAETELTSSEHEALGADFITVELDTQPIEYVVKWAEVGSKFTISCVKKDSEEGFVPGEIKPEPDENFFATYESVYPECIVEESVEVPQPDDEEEEEEDGLDQVGVRSDSDDDQMEPGSSQLGLMETGEMLPPPRWRGGGGGGGRGRGGRSGTRAPKGSGSHACHVCGKCYSHSSSLSRHVQTHRRGNKLMGGGGHSVAHAAAAVHAVAHVNQHKDEYGKVGEGKKTLVCNVCGVRCNGKRLLAIHKKSHKAKRLHTCNLCGKHFNHSSSLSRHRLIHKGKARPGAGPGSKGQQGSPLVLPELTLVSPGSMGKPKKRRRGRGGALVGGMAGVSGGVVVTVGGEKQYQCTQCDKVFRNSTQLSRHQVAHVRQLLNSYAQDSKDPLAKSSDLKIRLKLCSRDKPNCYTLMKKNKRSKAAARARLAAATAAAAAAVAQPQRSPDPERPYACLHCDKSFRSTASLARHENSHAGAKQYPCGICRKSFVRLSNLKQHQQTHATGKLYSCLHCGKTFVHSSSFSRHKKVHSGEPGGKQGQRNSLVIDESAPLESDSE